VAVADDRRVDLAEAAPLTRVSVNVPGLSTSRKSEVTFEPRTQFHPNEFPVT